MGPEGFQRYAWNSYRLKVTIEEAETMHSSFFSTYSHLPNWHARYKQMARRDGYVVSPLGRVRHLPDINSPFNDVRAKAERRAINSPIQSALSDMMVWAIARLNQEQPHLIPFAMIHDAVYLYIPEGEAVSAATQATNAMSSLPLKETFDWSPQLKFTADGKIGPDMGHLSKPKKEG
jgi:DNA polymerase I-like protein with 3'-5' exonuclease and polymerase domains